MFWRRRARPVIAKTATGSRAFRARSQGGTWVSRRASGPVKTLVAGRCRGIVELHPARRRQRASGRLRLRWPSPRLLSRCQSQKSEHLNLTGRPFLRRLRHSKRGFNPGFGSWAGDLRLPRMSGCRGVRSSGCGWGITGSSTSSTCPKMNSGSCRSATGARSIASEEEGVATQLVGRLWPEGGQIKTSLMVSPTDRTPPCRSPAL